LKLNNKIEKQNLTKLISYEKKSYNNIHTIIKIIKILKKTHKKKYYFNIVASEAEKRKEKS
jgi:hypothetical protein